VEEVPILILQLLLELGAQILGNLGVEFATTKVREDHKGCGWLVLFILSGAIFGGISLAIFPRVLLATLALRVANLILAPLLAGGCSVLMVRFGAFSGSAASHFWRGFWFAMAFGLVRFIWTGR